MQEEVTQKTVTFCIRATKITADLLKKVLVAYLRYQNLYAIKEKCQHGSIQVPYSYYDCGIPDYFTSVPLHWHSEMELNYIKSGNGFFKYEDQTILSCRMSTALFFMIPLFFIRICWWEVTMTVVIQIFCCRSFLPDEEFWSLYLRNPRGIMNSMIRSGLLCSVHTKILQRLICY